MAWLYVPGLEGSRSDSMPRSEYGPFVMLSGKPTRRQLSWRGWKTRPWIGLLSGTISRPSTADRGVASWISSLRGSRVSRSVQPETGSAPPTSDGFGTTSSASFGKFDRDGSYSRTSLDLFGTDSDPSSEAWPNSGTMQNGICSVRKESERHIAAEGFSSSPSDDTAWNWPTPKENDSRGTRPNPRRLAAGTDRNLVSEAQNWATPTAGDAKSAGSRRGNQTNAHAGISLTDMVLTGHDLGRAWPTPDANCWKGGTSTEPRPNGRIGRDGALYDGCFPPVPTSGMCGPDCSPEHRRLNPLFVEWLMGWPIGWSSARIGSVSAETGWSRYRQQLRYLLSRIVEDSYLPRKSRWER